MKCTFPHCGTPASGHNRSGQPICGYHKPVVVTASYGEVDS